MNRLKQILAIALAVMITVALTPVMSGTRGKASATTDGWAEIGTCEWKITDDGKERTLAIRPMDNDISGTLPDDYTTSDAWPWNDERSDITNVVIEGDITAGNSTAYMFYEFTNLTAIYASGNFDVENVSKDEYMFYNCNYLEGGAGTVMYMGRKDIGKEYAHIDGGDNSQGFFSHKVTFDMQGHGKAPCVQAVGDNAKVSRPTERMAKGYNFGGWYKDAACKNAWNFDKDRVNGTTTIYAKWNSPARYFVVQGKSYKSSVKYTWNKVAGTSKYKVYQAYCGKTNYKRIATTSGTTFTKKKLKRKVAYKTYVVAYNAAGKAIAQTPLAHNMTTNGKVSNATAVKALVAVTVKDGTTANVKAKITRKDSKKKLLWKTHTVSPIRYYSADKSIVRVNSQGVVTGVKAGTAYVYSLAPTGAHAITKVTVEEPEDDMVTVTFKVKRAYPDSTIRKIEASNGKKIENYQLRVPEGCIAEYSGPKDAGDYYDKIQVTFKLDGEEYTTVTIVGEEYTLWGTSPKVFTRSKTIWIMQHHYA